jgi:hypothetical protein
MDDTLIPSADGSKRDLLHTRFAPSVLAVYRSSCLLIAGIRDLATAHPEPIRRWWFFWTTNYAAGVRIMSELFSPFSDSYEPDCVGLFDYQVYILSSCFSGTASPRWSGQTVRRC